MTGAAVSVFLAWLKPGEFLSSHSVRSRQHILIALYPSEFVLSGCEKVNEDDS